VLTTPTRTGTRSRSNSDAARRPGSKEAAGRSDPYFLLDSVFSVLRKGAFGGALHFSMMISCPA